MNINPIKQVLLGIKKLPAGHTIDGQPLNKWQKVLWENCSEKETLTMLPSGTKIFKRYMDTHVVRKKILKYNGDEYSSTLQAGRIKTEINSAKQKKQVIIEDIDGKRNISEKKIRVIASGSLFSSAEHKIFNKLG